MKKDDLLNMLPILVGLLGTIVSDLIADRVFRVLFVLAVMTGIAAFFVYDGRDEKKKKGVSGMCGGVAVVILFLSLWGNGITADDFVGHLLQFIGARAEESTAAEDCFQQAADANRVIESMLASAGQDSGYLQRLGEIGTEVSQLSETVQKEQWWESREDQKEIDQILSVIEKGVAKTQNDNSDKLLYPDPRLDIRSAQLFYKLWISKEAGAVGYYNMVKAMEGYGIDCERLEIDEYTLICWDVDRLFATYNMRKRALQELEADTLYEERYFYYRKDKAATEEYQDHFDYRDWRRYFTDRKGGEIFAFFDGDIYGYYDRFYANFGDM